MITGIDPAFVAALSRPYVTGLYAIEMELESGDLPPALRPR